MDMNSRERMLCAAALRKPDVVPVAPYMGNHGSWVAGFAIGEYCRSGKVMAEAQYKAWQVYGQDAVVAQSDNYYIAEGFGIETDHYIDSTPTLKTPVVKDLEDITRLEVPDPRKAGRMPVYLEAISRLRELTQGEVFVRAPGTGPFALASHLIGTERFLIELAEVEPNSRAEDLLRQLVEICNQALIAFAKACFDHGAHGVQAGDSLASNDMISPAMYRQWAFPYEKKFFDALNLYAATHGGTTLLHICGNQTRVLVDMADTGARIIELDSKVDLKVAKQMIGARVCLLGNLNPVTVLLQGSPLDVELAAEAAIAAAAEGGGYMLGSGCEVPPGAPQENLKAMVRAARKSRY
jgi:uroporphyrinogen decarboxylase